MNEGKIKKKQTKKQINISKINYVVFILTY